MGLITYKGKEVELSVAGAQDDIEITDAHYTETGVDLTDDEVYEIMDTHSEDLYEMWLDRQISAIDFMDWD